MKCAAVIAYANHEVIAEIRSLHRDYPGKLRDNGQLAISGPFADDAGALIVYETESEEEALTSIENGPFRKAGVFASYSVKSWNQIFWIDPSAVPRRLNHTAMPGAAFRASALRCLNAMHIQRTSS